TQDFADAHPQPVGAGSKLDRSRPLRLLSSQLDAVEVADSGFETQGAKIGKRLKRVPYKNPGRRFRLSAVVSPERMSAETQLDALGACLQPDCLAGCLHLAEDVCNRLADLPLPPPVLAPQHSQDGPARPHRRIRQSPPPPVSLELRLTNARLDLASAEHQILCVFRLSELRIEASATYERPASTGGAMKEYRLKRELQLECTGLEADTGRSSLVPNRQRRRLYAKPLLADLPDEPVARIRITSWPAGPGPSRLDIDCKLNKVQLVLLPELMAGLKEFSTSIQEPLEQLQSRLNWQAGDVLESAQTEIRQAGGLTARAEISAPRLILPLRGGAGNRALYADLGSLLLSSTSSSAQSNSDDTTDAVQFYEFGYSRPALKELFTSEDAVMTSSSDMALLADELRVRISGLSASVCQLAAGSRVGDIVVAGQGSNQLGNSSRLLRFYGESDGNKIGNEQPVLTAQIARLRCSDATISDEHCCQAWLAVAMETPGLRLVADRSDLLSIASLAASEIAESGEDSVDGVDQLGRPAGTRWAYDLSVGACSVGLVLRRQRPSTIWQLRLADAGVEAVAHDESEGEGGVQREPLDRWSIFSRSVSKSDSNSKPTDLLSIRSLPRSLTVRLAACQLRLWPDELPLLSDCMATMAAQGQPAPSNQAKPRETEPSSVAAAAASPEQRFSPALSVETSALRVQIFQNARPQPNSNHGNQTASGGGGGNAFCFQLGGFNGSFSETELTDLCLTFYKDGFRKPMTLQDSAIADGVELLSTETICLSLPAPTLIFKSRLNIRIAPSAVSSAVSIVNTWQPLLRPQQTAATTSASPASSKMFGSLTVATNTVSMVIGDSPTGAGSVAFSLDHLTVGFEHASCSATFERPSASASLTSTSAELIEEPLLILETPSSDSYQSACTYPRFQLAANWSADVTSVVLSCPLHRICLVVSPAVAAAIAQLVENLRQAFAGSRPSTKNDDIGREMKLNMNHLIALMVTILDKRNQLEMVPMTLVSAKIKPELFLVTEMDGKIVPEVVRMEIQFEKLEPEACQLTELDARIEPEVGQVTELDARIEPEVGQVTELDARIEPEVGQVTELDARIKPEVGQVTELDARIKPEVGQVTELDARIEPEVSQVTELDVRIEPEVGQVTELDVRIEPEVGDGTGRENGTGTGNGSQAWKFRVDLHSIGILLRLDSNLLTTMTTTPDGAACQRCRGSGRGCRNVANLSIDNVGPVWLKTKLTGVKRRFVRLKPDAAAAVERLYRRWLSTPVSSVLSNQSSVELVDSDQWRVCFEQLVNDNAITSSSSISSSMEVGMTMLQPKSRRLYRRCLPGFVGQVEFSQQPDKGEVNRPVRFQIKLGRLQVDQSCPQAPDQFRVPLSLKARPKADVLGEGRLLGADLKVCMAAAGSAEVEDDGASAQPPPLHISEMSLALGRLDLCYDPAFFVRLLATLTPQSDAPSSGVRIDRFQLLRNLRLYAENLPLRTSESAAQGNGWRLRATVPAGNALGVAWPDND
uniref:VPS13_C domain-containing protein n=1 Tax=Macrostomum lignano TaxID=282301 RepID=A0A1I8IN26_9PLAT